MVVAVWGALVALSHAIAVWTLATVSLVLYALVLLLESGYGWLALSVAVAVWFALAAVFFVGWEVGQE